MLKNSVCQAREFELFPNGKREYLNKTVKSRVVYDLKCEPFWVTMRSPGIWGMIAKM